MNQQNILEREDQNQTDDMKSDDMKSDDMKSDDMKSDDMKSDDMKSDDMKSDDMKSDDMKSDDSDQEMPKTGSDVKDMIVKSSKDTADKFVDKLIDHNREPNPNPQHRKMLGDFYHHVISSFDSFPDQHKEKIRGTLDKMTSEGISGADAVSEFVNNFDVYKPNVKNIMKDLKTINSDDQTKKLRMVMKNYKRYILN